MNFDIDVALAAIDWVNVKRPAGYSGAERVPEIIWQLLAKTNPKEKLALERYLYEHITYNEGVGESTLVTIPILLKLLDSPSLKRKGWLIRILGHLHFQLLDDDDLKKKLYDSMLDGMPLFHHYLGHRFPEYRLMASQTLSRFIHHPDLVSIWLRQAIEIEPKLEIKLKMIAHVGSLLRKNPEASDQTLRETIDFLLSQSKHDEKYVRIMALNAFLRIAEAQTPEQHIDQLFHYINQLGSKSGIEVELTSSILDTLIRLETSFRFDLLLRMLVTTKSPQIAGHVGRTLEGFHFRSVMTREMKKVTQLTLEQKHILDTLLANDLYWKGRGNFNLEVYGLAKNRSQLRKQVNDATIVG